MWKDFFYFSRRERQGILMLILLIAGVFLGKFLFTPKESVSAEVEISLIKSDEKQVNIPDTTANKNTNDSYLSDNQRTQVTTTNTNQSVEKRTYYPTPDESRASPKQSQYPVTEKFAAGTIIDINTSDTVQLMKIPGIGTAFAKRITSYRNLLGGFYRLEQLQEVYGMYEELYDKIVPYLRTDINEITQIPVNSASLDKLRTHPYINFYQAKAITETRKKKGKLENILELCLLEEFTEEDLERIKPYLAF